MKMSDHETVEMYTALIASEQKRVKESLERIAEYAEALRIAANKAAA